MELTVKVNVRHYSVGNVAVVNVVFKVVVCPAQTRDTNCVDCGLCAQSKRSCVVAFLAHGNRAKKLNATLSTIVQSKEVA